MGKVFSKGTKFTVFVKTGERFGMGTDATVSVAFSNEKQIRSPNFKLDNLLKNDFEAGQLDNFQITIENEDFGEPLYLHLRRDKFGLHDDEWYCEFVRLLSEKTHKVFMFPVHRWVRHGVPITVRENDAVLPQDDDNHTQRQDELQRKRDMYVPVLKESTGMIMCATLPKDETFSFSDQWDIAKLGIKLLTENRLIGLKADKWDSLDDLEKIYRPPHFPKPLIMENWKSDKEFGNQRLAGCNPAMIRLCKKIPPK